MEGSSLELTVASVAELAQARDVVGNFVRRSTVHRRVDDVVLVVSELVTNGLEHGSGDPVVVTVTDAGESLDLEVDSSTGRQRPVVADDPPDPSASRGRGLFVARALADSLTVDEDVDNVRIVCTFGA